MRTTIRATAAALALVGGLAACSSVEATKDDRPASASTSEEQPVVEEAPAEESPVDSGPQIAAFGETFTYEDGMSLVIGQPTGFTPSEWAAGAEGFPAAVKFDVTVSNGTAEAFDAILFSISGTSAGAPASQVFDSGQGIEGTPSAAILPGQSVTFPVVFAVNDPADLTFDVTPGGFTYDSVYYQGASA